MAEERHRTHADRDLDLYEIDFGSGARRAIVEAPGDDFAPQVANGHVYWTHNDPELSVVVVPVSGGKALPVIEGGLHPTWRPDGKQIGFTYGNWRLADWVLNLDGAVVDVDSSGRAVSGARPVITGYHEDFTPVWSPNGQWIAYHSHRSATPVSRYGSKGSTDDIYLQSTSFPSSEESRLTDFGVGGWLPPTGLPMGNGSSLPPGSEAGNGASPRSGL